MTTLTEHTMQTKVRTIPEELSANLVHTKICMYKLWHSMIKQFFKKHKKLPPNQPLLNLQYFLKIF